LEANGVTRGWRLAMSLSILLHELDADSTFFGNVLELTGLLCEYPSDQGNVLLNLSHIETIECFSHQSHIPSASPQPQPQHP
jgi:hypothetical protein